MTTTQIALSSLALDLKRVALVYHRGSTTMADRFLEEALNRKKEIDTSSIKPYLQKILLKIEDISFENENLRKAEDALLYSIIFQNAAVANKL